MAKSNADDMVYSTFIGIGVDFNTELVEFITKIRGANYYSVFSPAQFREQMDEEFEFMVTPLVFNLELHQRPGKCLACNLTYGLPSVFARHPVIDIQGVVRQVDQMLQDRARCIDWQLGNTREIKRGLHTVPLIIHLE